MIETTSSLGQLEKVTASIGLYESTTLSRDVRSLRSIFEIPLLLRSSSLRFFKPVRSRSLSELRVRESLRRFVAAARLILTNLLPLHWICFKLVHPVRLISRISVAEAPRYSRDFIPVRSSTPILLVSTISSCRLTGFSNVIESIAERLQSNFTTGPVMVIQFFDTFQASPPSGSFTSSHPSICTPLSPTLGVMTRLIFSSLFGLTWVLNLITCCFCSCALAWLGKSAPTNASNEISVTILSFIAFVNYENDVL